MAEIGLNNILAHLTPTVTLLKELNDAFGPPFVQPIAKTIESLINMVQVKISEHEQTNNSPDIEEHQKK
jgi:hypothetical protein